MKSVRLLLRWGVACAWLCAGVVALAAPREVPLGPPPAWVERLVPEEPAEVPVGQVSRGVYYLLSDVQTRLDGATRSQYRHFASKALNAQGVGTVANLTIDFDPSFQTLTLHALNVRRGGRVSSQLDAATIRVLRRERELEEQIFDGTRTASIVLDDVRVGDVVEYAYTLRGSNPVFGERTFGWVDLQWNSPVHRLVARLVVPARREIHLTHHNTGLQPTRHERGAEREYRWERRDVPALVVDDGTPGWYDPYPYAQWSDFEDWPAVVRWALPLYRLPERPSAALHAEIARIAQAHAQPGDRLLAVLRFVQREIRYFGIEIGAGSHAPSAPNDVLQRRFGDCKDKSLLAVAMLRALGIAAQPALVNTRRGQGVQVLHPTPGAFNHVIVRATVDGRAYWIDPTLDPQKGTLADLYQPYHGHALVIDAATRGLTPMPQGAANVYRRSISARIDSSAGTDAPMRYTVVTVHEGASAESTRSMLASSNREELQKAYLNFYAGVFEGIEVEAPFVVDEDPTANRLTVTERYRVPGYWKTGQKQTRRDADVAVPDLEDQLRAPRERLRSAPLAVKHPVDLTHTTEVLLPPGRWRLEPEQARITDPAFELSRSSSFKDRRLVLSDRYVTRLDHVGAGDMPRYLSNLQRARDAVGYSLFTDSAGEVAASPAQRFNWAIGLLALALLALFAGLAQRVYRHDPPPHPAPAGRRAGAAAGWLLWPALGVAFATLRVLWYLLEGAGNFAVDAWSGATVPGGAGYDALWAPALLWDLVTQLALLVMLLLVGVLLLRRRSSVPRLFVGVLAAAVAARAGNLLLLGQISGADSAAIVEEVSRFGGDVIALLAWGAYFGFSRRARAAFTERLDAAPAPLPAAEAPPLREAA